VNRRSLEEVTGDTYRDAMDVILVPGLWLDASSWETGVPAPASSEVGIQSWVDAVVALIDVLSAPDDELAGVVTLVGHSGGAHVVWAAAEARADRVARVVMVDSLPPPDGGRINAGLPEVDGVVPFPGWDFFGEDAADIPPSVRATWAARATTVPARVPSDRIALSGTRRFSVPVTLLMGDRDEDALRAEAAHRGARTYGQELEAIRDLSVVRLGSGHWPQFSQPGAFARTLVAAVG